MASLSTDKKSGTHKVQFIGGDGKRRTLRLPKCNLSLARSILSKVENLIACNKAGMTDPQTGAWLGGLDDTLYDRLVRVGLAPERNPTATTLGGLLSTYFDTLDAKPGTKTTQEQTRRCLLEYFGEDCPLASIDTLQADKWRKSMVDAGLAEATISRRVKTARTIFKRGMKWDMVHANPFAEVRAGSQRNPKRLVFVPLADVHRVLNTTDDPEWRLLIALARYGGLRIPTEALALRWKDVDWEHGVFTVHSSKTEGYAGGASRVVPIFPELLPHLRHAFEQAPEGAEYVITRYRDSSANLRTQFTRLIRRAGLDPWPRLWANLRASRATELAADHPSHVAAAWLGHSEKVADAHYRSVREEDFKRASTIPTEGAPTGDVKSDVRLEQNTTVQGSAENGKDSHPISEEPATQGLTGVSESETPFDEQCEVTPMGLALPQIPSEKPHDPTPSDVKGDVRPDDRPSLTDPDLIRIIQAWPTLAEPVRAMLIQFIDATRPDASKH